MREAGHVDTQKSTAITPLSVPTGFRWSIHDTRRCTQTTQGLPIQRTFAAEAVHSCRMRDLSGCAEVTLIGKAALHIIPRVGRGLAVAVAGGREFYA